MHTYHVRSGRWSHPSVGVIGVFYSGNGDGKNNPEMDSIPRVGPIPVGKYMIGMPEDRPSTGKYSMKLTPLPGTEMHGRDAFWIHGDKVGVPPGQTSLGCIVGPRVQRWTIGGTLIGSAPDNIVEVVAD